MVVWARRWMDKQSVHMLVQLPLHGTCDREARAAKVGADRGVTPAGIYSLLRVVHLEHLAVRAERRLREVILRGIHSARSYVRNQRDLPRTGHRANKPLGELLLEQVCMWSSLTPVPMELIVPASL